MQTRFDFLASGALAALTPAVAAAAPASPSSATPAPSAKPSLPPFTFDMAAFDAALSTNAEHRHMFASTRAEGGLAFGQMRGVVDAYTEIGIAATAVRPVAVLYHGVSVFLGFDDTIWNDYFIPLYAQKMLSSSEAAKDFESIYDAKKRGNPCLHKTGTSDDSSVEALVALAGARFFVCDQATRGFSRLAARKLKHDPLDTYATFTAHLVPNAMLVPAGIWAVHAVQERRYTYMQCTLQA
jgi:hypothetical protein